MRHREHEWTFPIQEFWDPVVCPRCNELAYRVSWACGELWFDELKPPWTKHPCMPDDSASASARTDLVKISYRTPNIIFGIVVYVHRDGILRAKSTDGGQLEGDFDFDEIEFSKNPRKLAGRLIVFDWDGGNLGQRYWFI